MGTKYRQLNIVSEWETGILWFYYRRTPTSCQPFPILCFGLLRSTSFPRWGFSLIPNEQDTRHLWTHFRIDGAKECQVVPHIIKVANTSIHDREFFLIYFNCFSRARFRRRTFHKRNLIHLTTWNVRCMNACLERLSRSFRIFSPSAAWNFDFGSTLERLHVPNLMHKFL